MAEPKSTWEQIGLSPSKAALIGILAVVLAGVLYLQYGGSEAQHPPAEVTRRPAAMRGSPEPLQQPDSVVRPASGPAGASTGQPADGVDQTALLRFDQARWQSPDVTEVLAYDPFALPETFPQPQLVFDQLAPEEVELAADARAARLAEAFELLQRQLEQLQQRGVQVIVSGGDQYAAMIGDRTVRVGDEIDGFTVTAIDPDGVRVERKGVE